MPQIPIIMPQLGESIAEATVVRLLVRAGDKVEADQDVLEVETNKATLNVATPCAGRVHSLLVKEGESYPVGAVLGHLEASAENIARVRSLSEIAKKRGQSLAQMAIAWVLRDRRVTSALIGARNVEQLDNSLDALKKLEFSDAELAEIEHYAQDAGIDLWRDAREKMD